jgi:hypothetical protein
VVWRTSITARLYHMGYVSGEAVLLRGLTFELTPTVEAGAVSLAREDLQRLP